MSGALNSPETKPHQPPGDTAAVFAVHLGAALRAVAPHLSGVERAEWVEVLGGRLCKAAITKSRRVAAFLGQCAVESGGFQILEEDLSYSAARLCEVWPERFPDAETAEACAFQPQALADHVYANRMGNGDPASGDGWFFRGRGLIQITGRTAYERFAKEMNMTLDQAVAHASTPAGAADSAVWFWSDNDLNKLADSWLLDRMTRKINGGPMGAAERNRLCTAALRVLGG
nr:glycoside hydrolase family 19 protein [uncultured Rhodopila sp.]